MQLLTVDPLPTPTVHAVQMDTGKIQPQILSNVKHSLLLSYLESTLRGLLYNASW